MKSLLDTHTFLWFVDGSPKLSHVAATAIESAEKECWLSIVSAWEIAIKVSLGKLSIAKPFDHFLEEQVAEKDIQWLSLSISHLNLVTQMPFHYRDPFDRLLVAQCLCEGFILVSADPLFDQYGINRL